MVGISACRWLQVATWYWKTQNWEIFSANNHNIEYLVEDLILKKQEEHYETTMKKQQKWCCSKRPSKIETSDVCLHHFHYPQLNKPMILAITQKQIKLFLTDLKSIEMFSKTILSISQMI